MLRTLIGSAVVVAVLGLLLGSASFGAAQVKDSPQVGDQITHEGTVVSVTGNKLVMRDKGDGKNAKEMTHTLAPNAKVTCDGKACILSDLKPGLKVRVFFKKSDPAVATRVEALDKQKSFEAGGIGGGKGGGAQAPQQQGKTHEGTVVSVSKDKIVMKGADKKEHTHTLAKDAKITCDGKACILSDLKPGQRIRVTTAPGNLETATRIEALDKMRDFGPAGGTIK
jgi:hypothetical protein